MPKLQNRLSSLRTEYQQEGLRGIVPKQDRNARQKLIATEFRSDDMHCSMEVPNAEFQILHASYACVNCRKAYALYTRTLTRDAWLGANTGNAYSCLRMPKALQYCPELIIAAQS